MNLEQNIMQIPVEEIIPNRFQPRLTFDERGLEELANSIKQHGIIQPLVLRRVEDKYEIIAGERRYKAAIIAGLTEVPGIVANIDDNKSAEVAIVENVQRRNLTPIEEAKSYKNLLDKGYLTQSELAKKMGISQSAIANKLRLLNLDEKVQEALLKSQISERHARSLLVLSNPSDQQAWLKRIIDERMTVRDLDAALKKELNKEDNPEEESDIPLVKSLDIDAIRKEATELPSIDKDSDIARKLQEIEREKMYNPDVVPVEQATNKAKGNFFNFLEQETVNMNTEETSVKTPPINLEFPSAPEMPKEEKTPPVEEDASTSDTKPVLNSNFGTPVEEKKPEEKLEPEVNEPDTLFDPVNLIDSLDPSYEPPQEEANKIDLKEAINEVRNIKDVLNNKGYKVSLEETDIADEYQFIIKIKKD